jgi:hypothetical protein
MRGTVRIQGLPFGVRIGLAVIVAVTVQLALVGGQIKWGEASPTLSGAIIFMSEVIGVSVGLLFVREETRTHPGLVTCGVIAMLVLLSLTKMAMYVAIVGV